MAKKNKPKKQTGIEDYESKKGNLQNHFKKGRFIFQDENSKIKKLWDLEQKKIKGEEVTEASIDLAIFYGLDNGIWAAHLSYSKYNAALSKMRDDIIKQYQCDNAIEKMLADRIVASYWKSMKYDATINRLIEKEDGGFTFNDSKMQIIDSLVRASEKTERQLQSTITLLKQMKAPPLNVKLSSVNTFIAENQAINPKQDNAV